MAEKNNGYYADPIEDFASRYSRDISDRLKVDHTPNSPMARGILQQIAENTHDSDIVEYDKRERKHIREKNNTHSVKVSRNKILDEYGEMIREYHYESNSVRYYIQIKVSKWSAAAQKLFFILFSRLASELRSGNTGITEVIIPEAELIDAGFSKTHKSLKQMIEGTTGGKMNEVETGTESNDGSFEVSPIFSGKRKVKDGLVIFGIVNVTNEDTARLLSIAEYYAVIPHVAVKMSQFALRICQYIFEQARMYSEVIGATGKLEFTFEEISRACGLKDPENVDPKHVGRECIDPILNAIGEINKEFKSEYSGKISIEVTNQYGKPKSIYSSSKIVAHFEEEWREYFAVKHIELQTGKDANIKRIKEAKKKREQRANKGKDAPQTKQERNDADNESLDAVARQRAREEARRKRNESNNE